jgi:hypothetical protein
MYINCNPQEEGSIDYRCLLHVSPLCFALFLRTSTELTVSWCILSSMRAVPGLHGHLHGHMHGPSKSTLRTGFNIPVVHLLEHLQTLAAREAFIEHALIMGSGGCASSSGSYCLKSSLVRFSVATSFEYVVSTSDACLNMETSRSSSGH